MSARLRSAEDTPLARFEALMAEASAAGADLDPSHLAAALGELEAVRVELWARLAVPATTDRLLTAAEAAQRLGVSLSALYRGRWPFRVKLTAGRVRYSSAGIERFIRSRAGR